MTGCWLGWLGIVRMGLVQTAIGAIAVLTTVTLNRIMVVEMALPAGLPAAFIAWHYFVQLSRPGWGHRSDRGHNRVRWILLGMGILALGALLAVDATIAMKDAPVLGVGLGIVAYTMIGGGVAASGTSLLALLSTRVEPARRPAAAAIAWIMMIAGIVLTAGVAGQMLDPFSPQRLVAVASCLVAIALIVVLLAVRGMTAGSSSLKTETSLKTMEAPSGFIKTIRQTWRERLAREFAIFIFISMLAYSAQELILEPYAGLVFGMSLGKSTQLAGIQHAGVLVGMVLAGGLGTYVRGDRTLFMRRCTFWGCLASAAALVGLAVAGFLAWPLMPLVFALGLANGAFAVSALGLMMSFAGREGQCREGIRVGVWGGRAGERLWPWRFHRSDGAVPDAPMGGNGADGFRRCFRG
ncbi:BCD family MFS transporter [Telmatospirillum siberiense]|uniref:BCD family MFS transporter n=1 Tax=Telmatospirillum siberiense TaxID=382514 RepID=UPI00237B8F53|nr:BCD family MFS transporter [Telmatospirillum siberiense]